MTLLDSMTEKQREQYEDYLEDLKNAKTVKEVRWLSAEINKLLDQIEKKE